MPKSRFFSRPGHFAALSVIALAVAAATAGCSSSNPPMTASQPTAASTVSVPEPSLAQLPVGEPVDVVRSMGAPFVWNAVLANQTVAYVESDSFGFVQLGQPQPTQTAVIKTLDLETRNTSAIPGGDISSPESFYMWPWWFLAGITALMGEDTGPSFVWGLESSQTSSDDIGRWKDITGWNPSTGTKALLDPETVTQPPIRTGDFVALPCENRCLILTGSLGEPIAVDPAAPMLPASSLVGISPYITWSGWRLGRGPAVEDAPQFRDDLPGKPPRVFDLRSGALVDIAVEDPRPPRHWSASVVAGHWAAWAVIESDSVAGSLYLADLTTGRAERLLDGDVPVRMGLSEDWLLWTDAAGDLMGYHLPDRTPLRVPDVLAPGEYDFDQNLQICGDLALLMVVAPNPDSDAIGPSDPPMWTAVRVVRLR